MKKILLASGCSYTMENYVSAHHPDMKCDCQNVLQLLADKLGMDCINVGQSGNGQEYIYTSIVNNIHRENIGLVIAGWSSLVVEIIIITVKIIGKMTGTKRATIIILLIEV